MPRIKDGAERWEQDATDHLTWVKSRWGNVEKRWSEVERVTLDEALFDAIEDAVGGYSW